MGEEHTATPAGDAGQVGAELGLSPGLACLLILARFHGRALDPVQIRHHFETGGDIDAAHLARALREIGLSADIVTTAWERLGALPLPAILMLRDGGFAVLAKFADDAALVQYPGAARAEQLTRAEVEAQWDGRVVVAAPDLGAVQAARFGLHWFVQAVMKYRRLLAEVVGASFFLQVFALVTPLVFQIVIDKVLMHRALNTLDVLVFALIVVMLFEAVLGGLRAYLFAHTTNRIDVELGAKLFRHLLALPLSYFDARRIGDTVARVRELETVRHFLTGSALTLVLDLFFTVVFLAVMLYYSAFLTLVLIFTLPLFFAVSLVLTPWLRTKLDEKFSRGAENQAFLVETVAGIETLKGMAAEPAARRHWEERLAHYVAAAFEGGHLASLASQWINLISKALTILLLWLGARLVLEGGITVGQLIAFNMLAARVTGPILRIAQIWQDFQQMRVSLKRLGDILDAPTEPALHGGRPTPPAIAGHVRFERVGFRYRPDGAAVLHDVSFEAHPGEVVAIVGASGSGKSTLIKLLQRLYVPEHGRIFVDDVDIALADPTWLRRQIGVVAQDAVLFNRSVRENIALTDAKLDMARIADAARLAGAHDFIMELPDGYDTPVGERGNRLSGGQRQRIAIARALARDPRILILDEATSALDYESERAIQANMRNICVGRTVFIAAHRLSTVRGADRILTLERGRLVEQGDHDSLIDSGGRYAELYRSQEVGGAAAQA